MSSKKLIVGEIDEVALARAIELYNKYDDERDSLTYEEGDALWSDYYQTTLKVCYVGHALASLIYNVPKSFRTVANIVGAIKLLGLHTQEVDYGDKE